MVHVVSDRGQDDDKTDDQGHAAYLDFLSVLVQPVACDGFDSILIFHDGQVFHIMNEWMCGCVDVCVRG